MKNYKEGLKLLINEQDKTTIYAIDIHWKLLQGVSNWFVLINRIGYQYPCYSDIEKKYIEWNC